jgi:hypothetical protein
VNHARAFHLTAVITRRMFLFLYLCLRLQVQTMKDAKVAMQKQFKDVKIGDIEVLLLSSKFVVNGRPTNRL